MFNSEWFWLFLALLIFWALGAHNRLVRLRAQVSQRFFALEVLLLKYPDVVSEAVTAAAVAPLGWRSTVGFDLGAEHWSRLQEAAKEAIIALARMNEHPLNAQSSVEVNLAVSTLAYAWHVLVHPDVFFLSVPEELRKRWHEIGVLTQPELERFNLAVDDYNGAIQLFPASLLAKVNDFTPARKLGFEMSPQLGPGVSPEPDLFTTSTL